MLVTRGAAPTRRTAADEVAVPAELVKTARKRSPSSPAAAVKLSAVAVAPGTSAQSVPSLERCHCTVGAGAPEAAVVKVASSPGATVTSVGCVVTRGPSSTCTVSDWVPEGATPLAAVSVST